MKTDRNGGSTSVDQIEARLARQFEVELDRAEQDYRTFGPGGRAALARPNQPRRRWPSLAALLAIVAGIAILVPLSSGYLTAPAVPAGPGSGVVLGSDGIPTSIDGERVYRVGEKVESQKQGGFLLGGYVFQDDANCQSGAVPPVPCFGLGPTAGSNATTGGIDVAVAIDVSDPNPPALGGWLGAPVVVRAKGCTWDNGTPCPPVVMAVVWPTVPAEIDGGRVYRAADRASFPSSGSFLLGGEVTMPDVLPPCPMPIDHTTAENDLIPYCYWEAIDGIRVAPKVDALANLRGRIVVARVHINDPEAAACPAAVLDQCRAALVVEEVDWTGGPSPSSSPGPSPVATSPVNPASASQGEAESQPANSGLPTPLLPPPSALPAPSASPMHSGT
jgi:hypothetical protein